MVGLGYDVHKLKEEESFILGGIEIDSEYGTVAHSDGDVLLHALCDALLGATGLGDIGELFPDTDMKYKDADSTLFVKEIMQLINEKGFELINIDATIVLEKPKLKPYKEKIKNKIAELCSISADRVNIKAKTSEKMGFVGRNEGVASFCICEIKYK